MIVDETADIIRELYGKYLKHITIERMVIGIFFAGVKLSTGSGGVSYTPAADIHGDPRCGSMSLAKPGPGSFQGTPVSEILDASEGSTILNTVRLIVLNALSPLFLTENRYKIMGDCDVLDNIDLTSIKRVAMVGAIGPLLTRFKGLSGVEIHVIEKKKQSLRKDELKYYVPSENAGEIIPLCDTVVITGATVANGSIDELLGLADPAARVIVTGPTVSFLPDALFKRHVDIVSGTVVTDVDRALNILAEGGGAYHLFHTSCLRKINIMEKGAGN
ncbi:MAG: hypothetical protein C0399_08500 [Syntrophus sp. (in: bacteria)]|nr:hypothetical protein [Syntrophus sp. (in: bacteria)]